MKLFTCENCEQVLYFENVSCERCGCTLGYLPERNLLTPIHPTAEPSEEWRTVAKPEMKVKPCANRQHGICNWLVPADSPDDLCLACSLNKTIPSLDLAGNLQLWKNLEFAKHRLIYSLLRFQLAIVGKAENEEIGLAFDLLQNQPDQPPVMTGHDHGLITINIAEADPVNRERSRESMGERYRTILGHFRHEVGHYYWDQLIKPDSSRLERFRSLFGDETADYSDALKRHYEVGPPAGWQQQYVSAYASAHPWEDWAETWAHYLHFVDTLDTAFAFDMHLRPFDEGQEPIDVTDPYEQPEFTKIRDAFLPVSYALNSLNRSMGQNDAYPFVISSVVMEKLEFVHCILKEVRGQDLILSEDPATTTQS